jgi:DNA-binding HxlR family transcriptional regulator
MGRIKETRYQCAIEVTLDLIAGKWKALILCHLAVGTSRFGMLKRTFPRITQKMLTQQLREMEKDGLLTRTVYAQVPPKVEYTLTPFGESLLPVIQTMSEWGKNYLEQRGNPAVCCGACFPINASVVESEAHSGSR